MEGILTTFCECNLENDAFDVMNTYNAGETEKDILIDSGDIKKKWKVEILEETTTGKSLQNVVTSLMREVFTKMEQNGIISKDSINEDVSYIVTKLSTNGSITSEDSEDRSVPQGFQSGTTKTSSELIKTVCNNISDKSCQSSIHDDTKLIKTLESEIKFMREELTYINRIIELLVNGKIHDNIFSNDDDNLSSNSSLDDQVVDYPWC